VLKLQYITLLVSVVSLAKAFTGIVTAGSGDVYCYNQAEGHLCFQTEKN
jgi:hypothetical protein